MAISPSRTVAQLVIDRPARARIFERLGIDYCCNGDRSLAQACRESGLDPTTVADLLDAAVDSNPPSPPDWTEAPLGDLIDHIVDTHHAYLRRELPQLENLLMGVTEAHGSEVPWLDPVLEVFQTLKLDLETHMMTEEERVFPSIRALSDEAPSPKEAPLDEDGIEAMIKEHDDSEAALKQLREWTDDYTAPQNACPECRTAMSRLRELETDTHQHVHEENNILFPRARALV